MMCKAIPSFALTFILMTLSSVSDAGIWIWFLTEKPQGPHFEFGETMEDALEVARSEHSEWFDDAKPKFLTGCKKTGYFALIEIHPPFEPVNVGERFSGVCGRATRDEAFRIAIRSCLAKHKCAESIRDASLVFRIKSFLDNNQGEAVNYEECAHSRNNDFCDRYNGDQRTSGSFDRLEFINKYEK